MIDWNAKVIEVIENFPGYPLKGVRFSVKGFRKNWMGRWCYNTELDGIEYLFEPAYCISIKERKVYPIP